MSLLGESNWYLPRWLDRLLPRQANDPRELPQTRTEFRHAAYPPTTGGQAHASGGRPTLKENGMTSTAIRDHTIARSLFAVGLAAFVTGVVLALTAGARADSTPVGPLPPGPVSTVTAGPNQLTAVALPEARKRSGLVWRIARRYDAGVVRQVSEATVGPNVVLVFRVIGRGGTSLVFALTRGDTSRGAVKALTHKIRSR